MRKNQIDQQVEWCISNPLTLLDRDKLNLFTFEDWMVSIVLIHILQYIDGYILKNSDSDVGGDVDRIAASLFFHIRNKNQKNSDYDTNWLGDVGDGGDDGCIVDIVHWAREKVGSVMHKAAVEILPLPPTRVSSK